MQGKKLAENELKEKKDANTCIALGAGVGILGTASAVLTGAVCPLCVVVAPGLIGYGAYRRWSFSDKAKNNQSGASNAN